MSNDLSRFLDAFFEETEEHLTTIEEGLLHLEQRPEDLDLLNRVFRGAHSIKGTAGMFGFAAIGDLTHKMETVLDQLRTGQMSETKVIIDVLLESNDALKELVQRTKAGETVDGSTTADVERRLEACAMGGTGGHAARPAQSLDTPPPAGSRSIPTWLSGSRSYRIIWTPGADVLRRGMDPQHIFRELKGHGTLTAVQCHRGTLPRIEAMDPETCYLGWTIDLSTERPVQDIEGVFDFVRDGSDLTIADVPTPNALGGVALSSNDASEGHKKLGEILMEEGILSPPALAEALAQQKPLGQILIEQHAVRPQQIAKSLENQQKLDRTTAAKKGEPPSIRVDTTKIDRLINLIGELVITQSMLSDLSQRFTPDKLPVLQERIDQLERNTREIQERVMSIRMLPISSVFNRFPRLVRDLSERNNKQIQLVMTGEETELDKTVIESIGDPLTHLVRNSADHGLEMPEERVANGKAEQGAIRMGACHEGGSICITVSDDGRGLNREKILKKALQNGLVTEADQLTDDQVWNLIFKPGFSTAEQVTDVSGRGVGMDVVKRNIESLGGTVSIKTEAGNGTTFRLKLPLTLAIIDGLTVRVGEEMYIVPLIAILESVQAKASSFKSIIGKGEVLNVRGEYVPVVRLYEVFRVKAECEDPLKAIFVIMETEGERVAVMVDELLEQQQVVIKTFEKNFRKIEGVAGATILGSGMVAFILDVRGLLALSRQGVLACV
jgi:two-component system chemotaxis sensor kinase CheA